MKERSWSRRKSKRMISKRHLRIVLVDDHPSVLAGLRARLDAVGRITVVGESMDGVDAIRKAERLMPHIMLIDLRLPGKSGIEVMNTVHERWPHIGLIAYTMHDGQEYLKAAMEAGAAAYVSKTVPLHKLIKTIISVADHRRSRCLCPPGLRRGSCPELAGSTVDDSDTDNNPQLGNGNRRDDPAKSLTKRETQIVRLIMQGLQTKQIADVIGISPTTMAPHMRHIYEKLGVHSRATLLACLLAKRDD